jgi:hypothetical protein
MILERLFSRRVTPTSPQLKQVFETEKCKFNEIHYILSLIIYCVGSGVT